MHRDGQRGAVLPVEVDELAVVQRRQDVPVHHEERPVEVGHRAQRARGAERPVLPVKAQLQVLRQRRAGAEYSWMSSPEVAHAEVDAVDARAPRATA